MAGAPTPHIDRLAREGLLLTSCYSEPSCTPSRASLMTGRLPMRHGLLVPPMYGMPGGLAGEVTLRAAPLRRRLRDPGRRQVAHGREPRVAAAERRLRRLLRLPVASRTCTPNGVTRTSSPRSSTATSARNWIKNEPFNKCWVHAQRGGEPAVVEEVTIPVLSRLDDEWAGYSERFIERMAGQKKPWFLYHCTRGAHFDNYPHEKFRGKSPSKHPYKDTIIELDDIVGRLVRKLEATGQLENTLVFVSSDNGPEMETWPDAAFTPFRCAKGSTWEGGVRVPGVLSWPGMIEPRTSRRAVHAARPVRDDPQPGRRARARADRPLRRRDRPDLVPARARRPDQPQVPLLLADHQSLGRAGRRVQVHDDARSRTTRPTS